MNDKAARLKLAQLYAAVASDDALKQRFKTDPVKVLKEFGIEVPAKIKLAVHENTAEQIHLVIPVKEDKDSLAGGWNFMFPGGP